MADPIVFAPVIDAELATVNTSNTEDITSVTGGAIAITGGTYSINGGAFTAVAGTVVESDTVSVRLTTSTAFSTTHTVTLTVEGTDSLYLVTTKVLDSSFFFDILGLTPSDIPSSIIDLFIVGWEEIYPDNECQVIYHTIISIYNWLVQKSNATAISGKRKEKKGRREIEVENSNTSSNWKTALDNFIKTPWDLLPQCRLELSTDINSRITIGGVKKDEVERVQDNSNSYGQYQEKSPFSPRRKIRKRITGFSLK